MNVVLVSECSKRALVETRRVLDQFAERKGERTWQTAITQQGLLTLRKMLRRTAKKNTAVACHWIKGANRSELLWIVGNAQRFNDEGTVPTNTTERDILRGNDENLWNSIEDVSVLAGIAGLFHDFGKANKLFQRKLRPSQASRLSEPYRHEWVSLCLFQQYVNGSTDKEWLSKLAQLQPDEHDALIAGLPVDGDSMVHSPFQSLPPFARAVAWLIMAHHRLPKWPGRRGEEGAPRIRTIDRWIDRRLTAEWNSPQLKEQCWTAIDRKSILDFTSGLPIGSATWRAKAHSLAVRALKRPSLFVDRTDWFTDPFTLHVARMVLMLADHYYSAHDPTPAWQDKKSKAYANTERQTGRLKQKLDEHVIGVGHNAVLVAKRLPTMRLSLPAITRHRGFKKRSADPRFRWQDKAYDLACGIRRRSEQHGFFGVDMASTGCGKTLGNGRIMYGLADEKAGCRFTVALGLRTLTLQTGDALRSRLRLQEDDLAVLIGSQAVQQLHELHHPDNQGSGSESAEELLDELQHVRYDGALDDGRLSVWLRRSPKLHRLVSAPILVSTIDHLMPATEGERGGKQIAPMLRLLTSDLVLDEPDEFGLADLPALTRVVNWAGMLGSRVLVSSATLPPALLAALFEAYLTGRGTYEKACGEPGQATCVCCAWFDEQKVMQSDHSAVNSFVAAHEEFASKRVGRLRTAPAIRRAALVPVDSEEANAQAIVTAISDAVQRAAYGLHAAHAQAQPVAGKGVSVGLVRMANINPLVAVAKRLMSTPARENHRIHYCVYHSQHPLAVRSAMENQLDGVLSRHDPDALWQQESVRRALRTYPEKNHLFIVLATAVAEVGRDHDYDWAIAEPSSMRSLIQLAGRIQRHRKVSPASPNFLILARNFRALLKKTVVFHKPGFETEQFRLRSHDLHDLLETNHYEVITSVPRIVERSNAEPEANLVDLEHAQIRARLYGDERRRVREHAALWWQHKAHWSFELQRRMPFRRSAPAADYVLYMEDEGQEPLFHSIDERGELKRCDKAFQRVEVALAEGVSHWGEQDMAAIAGKLGERMDQPLHQITRRFGVLNLPEGNDRWLYNSALGAHRDPE